jgi:hypothetical protein
MTKKIAVGLDVGSSTCHLVAVDPEGLVLRNLQFPTSEAKGIINLRLTKCEMIQYRACKKIVTAICCDRLRV